MRPITKMNGTDCFRWQTTWSTKSKRSNKGGRNSPLSPERGRNSRCLLFAHFGPQAATVELERDRVADLDLGGVAEDGTGGVGGDGVTAFEDFQRASFFELQGEARQALALGPQQAFGANAEIGSASFETQAKRCNLHAKIKRDDAQVRNGEPFA